MLGSSVPLRLYEDALEGRRTAEARLDALVRDTVPRSVHDGVVAQMQRQVDAARLDALFYMPLAVHESAIEALRQQLDHQRALTTTMQQHLERVVAEAMALKRIEQVGHAPDQKMVEQADPLYGLGPKTRAAIEDDADGRTDIRNHLIHFAHTQVGTLRQQVADETEVDAQLAAIIRQGDTA